MEEVVSCEDVLTSSGKYPERASHPECTEEVRVNAEKLAKRVSMLLMELELTAKVSSGFRPSDVNAATKGAAKKSNHMNGNALDLEGDELGYHLEQEHLKNLENSLLTRYDLYLEKPKFTRGWTHLQRVPPKSWLRVFIP